MLRDLTAEDAPPFIAYQTDPRYRAARGVGGVEPRDLLDRFVRWQHEVPRRNYQLGIFEHRPAGTLLGCAGLRDIDLERGTAELGIELAPDHWGRHALALEVAAALLKTGFQRLELRALYGVTTSGNRRVARLASWFGAEPIAESEGTVTWRISHDLWLAKAAATSALGQQRSAEAPTGARSCPG
jgi:ribosomal-protein-alanine N-acetyltransferase